jgi:hypothetical protein
MTDNPSVEDVDFLACTPCHVKRKRQKHQVFMQDGVYYVRCLNCERINLVLDNTEQIRAAEQAVRENWPVSPTDGEPIVQEQLDAMVSRQAELEREVTGWRHRAHQEIERSERLEREVERLKEHIETEDATSFGVSDISAARAEGKAEGRREGLEPLRMVRACIAEEEDRDALHWPTVIERIDSAIRALDGEET